MIACSRNEDPGVGAQTPLAVVLGAAIPPQSPSFFFFYITLSETAMSRARAE